MSKTRAEEIEEAAKKEILGWGENAQMLFRLGAEWADSHPSQFDFATVMKMRDEKIEELQQNSIALEKELIDRCEELDDMEAKLAFATEVLEQCKVYSESYEELINTIDEALAKIREDK